MDPDPEPDPTRFFIDFKNVHRYIVGYQACPFHFLRSCIAPVLFYTGFCSEHSHGYGNGILCCVFLEVFHADYLLDHDLREVP